MNVIDALFITLGLDTKDYEAKKEGVLKSLKTMGESSDKTTKTMAESGKKAAQAFSLLKIEVLGALAAFGVSTGFKDFIQSNMNGQAALGRFSANLGISTQRLEAWKLAAKEMGQSGEDAVSALQSVAKGIAEAQVNQSSPLSQAAIKYKFAIDPKSAENTLANINKRAAEIHDRQKALMMFEEAGVGALSNVLIQSPEKFQAQLARTMTLTGSATRESTEQAAKLQAEWADLQERFNQISEKIFNELSPRLIDLGKGLANWLDRVNWDHVAQVVGDLTERMANWLNSVDWKGVGQDITEVTGDVEKFASTFDRLTASYRKFANEWDSSLFGKIGKAAGWYHDHSVGVADWIGGIFAKKSAAISQGATESDARERGSPSDKAYRSIAQVLGFDPDTGDKMVTPNMNGSFDNSGKWFDLEKQQGLPTGLLYRIEQKESRGNPRAVSPKGALGAFQMLPSTAAQYGLQGDDVFDEKKEAIAAAKLLHDLLQRYKGDLLKAVAAYNEGSGNLEKYGIANPETINYVKSVLGNYSGYPGAKPMQFDPLSSGGSQPSASEKSVSVTIQKMEINAPQAKNARDIAWHMGEAIKRNTLIMGLNSSLG